MSTIRLGRTNREFPIVWLSPRIPPDLTLIDEIVESSLESGLPIDVSSQPALWGGRMRGSDRVFVASGTLDYARATDEKHACDLTQAHLIQTLSCIGSETIDFYLFRVRRMVEEVQLSGALMALEMARQEGHVRHLGLLCDGPPLACLGLWQFNDAFEVLGVGNDDAERTLTPLATERRVGVIRSVDRDDDWSAAAGRAVALAAVRSAEDVARARSVVDEVARV